MASFEKRGKSWRATIRIKDHPQVSETFPTKREAELWALAEEAAIRAGQRSTFPAKTLDQALTRYELEVSSTKRGGAHEAKRFGALRRDFPALCSKVLHTIGTDDLASWRDARLKTVTPGSVQRDISLLRNVWSVAANEWKWCAAPSPWRGLRMPGDNAPRRALWRWQEIRRVLRRLGYFTGQAPRTPREEVGWMFLLALQTGRRAGELAGLTRPAVDVDRGVITLEQHKTFEQAGVQRVPVPRRALKLLRILVKRARPGGRLFGVKPASVDTLFRRYREQVLIEGLTFHDSRATALTLLARRVDVMTLARISGHSDLKQILKTYYRESAEDIAARI